ncbi:putative FBD-associated F-box protein At5g22720 [Rosa rugosa]|uniref:putative FBD-associated F-box protein At5g22720 n=1 Tax=Rosa rugosa TaxID=74645 RepID=UPI002B40EB5C|nr:putative FBD-associated F-box protein At5g22720 [Rosa rugosa]
MKRKGTGINTARRKKKSKKKEDDENENTSGMVVDTYRSQLPDLVVERILSLISTRLAARASILSKQWARLWLSVPVIDLDEDGATPREDQRSKFMNFMRRYLKLRDKDTCIDKLRLRMRNLGGTVTITKWLTFAVERNVKELDICLVRTKSGQRYKPLYLSKTLLLKSTKSLTVLKLENVIVDLESTDGIDLPSLKTMTLKFVEFRTRLPFLRLLSRCPLLEYLLLNGCTWPSSQLKLSSSSLKSLQLAPDSSQIISKVKAVNLESFIIHCFHDILPFIKNISSRSCQKIRHLEFGYSTEMRSSWFEDLDLRFPHLERLILRRCQEPLGERIKISSEHLKYFLLFSDSLMSGLLCMSTNFPNLSEAVIILGSNVPRHISMDPIRRMLQLRDFLGQFDCSRKVSLHVSDAEV